MREPQPLYHVPQPQRDAYAHRDTGTVEKLTILAETGKIIGRSRFPDAGGDLERLRTKIEATLTQHASHGFDPVTNTWWAHDAPPESVAPEYIYRFRII